MPYLSSKEVDEIVTAAMAAGLGHPAARNVLIGSLNQGFANTLFDIGGNPLFQLYADLRALNLVDQLSDGSVPLRDWLHQAGVLARQGLRREADVFTKYEVRVDAQASGQHSMPDPDDMREVVNNEDIVHRDDMLDFWFLSAGALAGQSVVKLLVPRYENGVPVMADNGGPRRTAGTGWLITDQHIMTNHHVVKSRKQGEGPVSEADLRLQGANTTARFDYNEADDTGNDVEADKLEAWDEGLDFAVLRLKTAVAPKPLQIQKLSVVFTPGTYMPVNIIQHPSGHPKRVAIRNNLLTSADDDSIRYFTDTLTGSSGSPVFDDAWRVIALHRGSQSVRGVSFQGRDVAVVNVGTQITAILKYLDNNHKALRDEIQV